MIRTTEEIMLTLYNAGRVFLNARLRLLAKREQGAIILDYAIMLALIAITVALTPPTLRAAYIGVFNQLRTIIWFW
jgi:Flp pilus assembly pilin Flp